ncbi:hypothetical protein WP1_268 [Pseudomonas phage WP1]
MRIMSAPELSGVQMQGQTPEDALVLFVEEMDASVNGSTNGGTVFSQLVQSKFITPGVEKRAKSHCGGFLQRHCRRYLQTPTGLWCATSASNRCLTSPKAGLPALCSPGLDSAVGAG